MRHSTGSLSEPTWSFIVVPHIASIIEIGIRVVPQWVQAILPVQLLVVFLVLGGVPVPWAGVLVALKAELGEV